MRDNLISFVDFLRTKEPNELLLSSSLSVSFAASLVGLKHFLKPRNFPYFLGYLASCIFYTCYRNSIDPNIIPGTF